MKLRIFAAIFLIFTLSCSRIYNPFNPHRGLTSPSPDTDTPLSTINNLRKAYMLKDLTLYLSCLDRDSFRFYFNAQDTTVKRLLELNYGMDSLVWGYEEEKNSTDALFSSVNSIYLEFYNASYFYSSNRQDFFYFSNYYLEISSSQTVSEVAEGKVLFLLHPFDNKWVILRWEDYPL